MRKLRPKLSYANVMATLALFVALGGTSYAATKIGTRQIVNNSVRTQDIRNGTIRGRDLRRGTLTAREVNEDRLSTVPRSRYADTLEGQRAAAFKQRCPAGTVGAVGVCFEPGLRGSEAALIAAEGCSNSGRRLPTRGELDAYRLAGRLLASPPGEWTSELSGSPTTRYALSFSRDGSTRWLADEAATVRPYRCVVAPRD